MDYLGSFDLLRCEAAISKAIQCIMANSSMTKTFYQSKYHVKATQQEQKAVLNMKEWIRYCSGITFARSSHYYVNERVVDCKQMLPNPAKIILRGIVYYLFNLP